MRLLLLQLFLVSWLSTPAQVDTTALSKIRAASGAHSQAAKTLTHLSDVYGPRLMGTPNYYNSVLWIEQQLREWGIRKTERQPFDKGHRGWEVLQFGVTMTSPTTAPLTAYPLAYSESTDGEKVGEVLLLTNEDSVFRLSGKLKDKILLLQEYYQPVHNMFEPAATRITSELLKRAQENPDPNDLLIGYHSRRSTKSMFTSQQEHRKQKEKFFNFCKAEGVIALVEPSDLPYGILHADGNRVVPSYMKSSDITPVSSFVMANEHFGRLVRLIESGFKPQLNIHLATKLYNEPAYNVNLIADIEGSDPMLKDEFVIIGAHLDSWHAGTGAVDNASGCAVMIEALRLIQASGLRPRRTIRLTLWGGEEQVFAGSSSYIEKHVGNLSNGNTGQQHEKISAYLNLDNGAGKIRGVYLMGNEKVRPIFEKHLTPFTGNNTLTIQNANQTDHELFDVLNIPAFQFIQDPLDYMTAVHHTNVDLPEYVPMNDLKFNAEYVAYLAYQLAQDNQKLPRKQFNSLTPSRSGNTTFRLTGFKDARDVYVIGDFNNWSMFSTPLYRTKDGWECKLDLPKGRYLFKYIVDGDWTADPDTPPEKLLKDGKGHAGLTEKTVK